MTWSDSHPLEPAQATRWDGVTRKGKDRVPTFRCSEDFAALCWGPVSTFQPALGLRFICSLFHLVDQHPFLSQANVKKIIYYYKRHDNLQNFWFILCIVLDSHTARNSKTQEELTKNHTFFYKTLHIVLCYLQLFTIAKSNNYANTWARA